MQNQFMSRMQALVDGGPDKNNNGMMQDESNGP